MKNLRSDYGMICDIGGKRKGNQDSAFFMDFNLVVAPSKKKSRSISQKGILAMVCDGVSASNHGELGSSYVIRNLSSKIISSLIRDEVTISGIKDQLNAFIHEVNRDLLSEFKEEIEKGRVPKTTVVGTLVIGQFMWVFNAGDSRAFIIKDGQIGQISKDHIGSSAHEITQAFGQDEIEPEVRLLNWAFESSNQVEKPIFENKCVALLCSDGLTDKVSTSEITQIIEETSDNFAETSKLQTKVETLFKLSLERKIDDNVSIIALDLAQFYESLTPITILQLEKY